MSNQRANPIQATVGGMLVLVGGIVLMERAGLAPWSGHVILWPVLLIGFGLSKLIETRVHRPRRG